MSLRININSFDVDYGKPSDLKLAFNYSIADINRIGDKDTQGSRSYDIKLPATATNKQVFGYTEDVTVTNGFDHKQEYDCFVEFEGSRVIDGKARVKQARDNKGLDSYTITIMGDNAAWIPSFRDSSLTDLDFSDQEHIYNQTALNASEILAPSRHYVYPLINYGHFGLEASNQAVQVGDRYPAIRISEMLKRMFLAQGYKLESDFIDSDFFNRLFMPFSGKNYDEVLDESFRTDRLFRASLDGADNVIISSNSVVIPFNNDSTDGNFDNGGLYNNSFHFYEVDTPSAQEFVFNFDYVAEQVIKRETYILGVLQPLLTVITTSEIFDYKHVIVKLQKDVGSGWQNHIVRQGVTPSDNISTGFINHKAGDKWRCVIESLDNPIILDDRVLGTGTVTTVTIRTLVPRDNDSVLFYNNVQKFYAEGATVDLNRYLPDVNQLDFFTDLRDSYNWHVLTDFNRRVVYIEPRDDFFSGTPLDWTSKRNTDKGRTVGFMGANLSKAYTLKYADDSSDIILKNFKEDNERSFGSETIDILNVNSKVGEGFKSLKVFAPTIMKTSLGINLKNTEIPTMLDSLEDPKLKTSYKPRILYYAGKALLKSGDTWQWRGNTRVDYPKMTFGDIGLSGSPLLRFNDKNIVGLFQKYHRNTYNTINNSRVVNDEFYLTAADVETFDFRNPIFLTEEGETTYYHVNKISNYNPQGSGLTKVELIKIINPVPQAEENITVSTLPPDEVEQPDPSTGILANINDVTTVVKYTDNGKTKIVLSNG